MNWLLKTTSHVERMGSRGFGGIFFVAIFTLLPSCPYQKPRFKSFSSKAEGGRDLSQFICWRKSVVYMAPKNSACLIPTGWTLETEVLKDGSKTSFYYCQGTGQQFYTYFELMRYVEYAKPRLLGIYAPSFKSIKRIKNERKNSIPTLPRKKCALSIQKKSSSDSNSSTVDQSMASQSTARSESPDRGKYSESPARSESTDQEKDSEYMPESESSVMTDCQPSDIEHEVNQILTAEWDDLRADY